MSNIKLNELQSSGIINVNNQPKIGGLSIQYGDFGQADPELTKRLPSSVNLGLTSPGYLDNASECTGVDFISTNPPYDSVTFKQCLDKFQDLYSIPEQGFASLLKNLPYTFQALTPESKKFYLTELKNFISKVEIENMQATSDNKEKFKENISSSNESPECTSLPNYIVNYLLVAIIIILIMVILCKSFFFRLD